MNLPVLSQLDKLKLLTSNVGGLYSLFSAIEKSNTFPKLSSPFSSDSAMASSVSFGLFSWSERSAHPPIPSLFEETVNS